MQFGSHPCPFRTVLRFNVASMSFTYRNDIEPNVKPQNRSKRSRMAPKLHTMYNDN